MLKRALTYTATVGGRRVKVQPSQKLLYAVYFSLGMVALLTALQTVHIIVLGKWNSEIFMVIAGLVDNITGIFLSQKT